MFDCKSCELLKNENSFLREQVKALQDRLMALADTNAYKAVTAKPLENNSAYFGGGDDDVISYNEYGERIIVKM
jgi:hypothetical protein